MGGWSLCAKCEVKYKTRLQMKGSIGTVALLVTMESLAAFIIFKYLNSDRTICTPRMEKKPFLHAGRARSCSACVLIPSVMETEI